MIVILLVDLKFEKDFWVELNAVLGAKFWLDVADIKN